MAKVSIKNIAPGARGVRNTSGDLVMVEPGQTIDDLDLDASERRDAEATGYFLFGDAAEADSIQALKKDDLLAIAEAEGVAIETDDNRSDLIRKIEEGRAARTA